MAPNDLTLHLCPEAGFEGVRHYTELVCCQRTNRVLETDHLKVGPFFVFDGSSWAGFPMIEHKATTVISAPHLSLPLFSLPSHAPPTHRHAHARRHMHVLYAPFRILQISMCISCPLCPAVLFYILPRAVTGENFRNQGGDP